MIFTPDYGNINPVSKRRKLEKFEALHSDPRILEMTEPNSSTLMRTHNEYLKLEGRWREEVFNNNNPLCVELACGRGEYTIALARKNPHINYIGVDIKGARIHQGAFKAQELGLSNVAFLRIRIEQIRLFFSPNELDEIWITFPDPFPNKENRRMTSPLFLQHYHSILANNGLVHFKTDDSALFEYTVDMTIQNDQFNPLYVNRDIYRSPLLHDSLLIKTYYEIQHLASQKTIKYLILMKK